MENLNQPPLSHRSMKYPNMCITQSRFMTFSSWTNINTADVESLVGAGFFYTGNEDHVRCFDCGIGLRSWEPEDDPMVEHARWSPTCKFVIENKGQEFIDAVQTAVRQLEAENLIGHSESEFNTTILNPDDAENKNIISQSVIEKDVLPCGRPPTAAERKNPLLTNAAQALIEYRYLPKTVKTAIDIVLQEKGWQELTSSNLLRTIFNLSNNGQLNDCDTMQPFLQDKILMNKKRGLEPILDIKQKILHENREMKERMLCKICCENIVCIAFLPCGHLISCSQCAPSLGNCPVCRTEVKGSFRATFAV
ncbi:baculoviral IAP repeat-containing protein 7-B-like [Mytilus californianus]|uniref:baculoviral IAP repeat-containing protein 7-B-like n=1 Tax=Mytilus californianus TaxID=6549 RepID=UPI0022461E29|nr:baculoviral IAP repeat-containing protein 7-B-like [Mytilus californianus]XP_052088579.1 baculoviral IAP repeat-containing protein 7-B-like [Mytilus californianus]XP_052088580.1 baculoviral IAP repeat-containing protein 7-B-like [Mytilus californianus]XP_052088582.1 baculoviral IAP repeat-containing protein 7-B-like [Mytilus californianus]